MRCQKCSTVMKEDEVVCPKCGYVHEQDLPRLDLNILSDPENKKKYVIKDGQPRSYYQEKGKRGIFAIIDLYKRAFVFGGVSDWVEYWTQQIFITIFGIANVLTRDVVEMNPIDFSSERFWIFSFTLVFIVFTAIPAISTTVRRLHDAGYSGFFYLITFVPIIGSFALLVLTLAPYKRNEHNDFYEKINLGE